MDHQTLPVLNHPLNAPSVFRPESLLAAVRAERSLLNQPVPEICVLEFDGDLTDSLVASGSAVRFASWACFHTKMFVHRLAGGPIAIVPRTIGGAYAVLVAEQLVASGAKVIIGLTSAGRLSPALPIPSLVVPTAALRDEGTSYHYLPPAPMVDGCAALAHVLASEIEGIGLPVTMGPVWTTDAPYRETQEQLDRHASAGLLAVEMQTASLFAFAAARSFPVGVVAHITNAVAAEEQFDKGHVSIEQRLIEAIGRAGLKYLSDARRRSSTAGLHQSHSKDES